MLCQLKEIREREIKLMRNKNYARNKRRMDEPHTYTEIASTMRLHLKINIKF
jgi:hypothetical protein